MRKDKAQTAGADRGSSFRPKDGRETLWFLVAFGFLAAGLLGGTILYAWRPNWAWPLPVAGFVGYVLAFRRGLLLWNPNIDGTWRQYLWVDGPQGEPNSNAAEEPSGSAKDLRIVDRRPVRTAKAEMR